VIACWLDPVIWLYTERQSYRFNVFRPYAWFYNKEREPVEGREALRTRLSAHGANYVFNIRSANHLDRMTGKEIIEMTAGQEPALETVFTSTDDGVAIYRVLP
jgi:hypothetical protein